MDAQRTSTQAHDAAPDAAIPRLSFGLRVTRILADHETRAFLLGEVLAAVAVIVVLSLQKEVSFREVVFSLVALGLGWLVFARLQILALKSEVEYRTGALAASFARSQSLLGEIIGMRIESLADEELAGRLKRLISGITVAMTVSPPPFREHVKQQLDAALYEMSDLSKGRIKLPVEISTKWAYERLLESRAVFATTFATSLSFWESPRGHKYLDANVEARKRHVEIVRAFILDAPVSSGLERIMKQHVDNAIEIWLVRAEDVQPRYRQDIAAFDTGEHRYVSTWDNEVGGITYGTWSTGSEAEALARLVRTHVEERCEKIRTAADLQHALKSLRASHIP